MPSQLVLDFYSTLGVGLDVDWCKNQTDRRYYSRALASGISFPAMIKDRGFDHARIRVKDYELTQVFEGTGEMLVNEITDRVFECNEVGLTAIVAFQGEAWKENPTSQIERDRVVGWWHTMALALKGYDCAFNILIETTLIGRSNDAALNQLYRECIAVIQAIDPDRICIVCPGLISAPEKLGDLEIPEGHVFVEAHFYAAGPSPFIAAKRWTTGTEAEKDLVRNKIRLMRDWSDRTGVPIWLGAISMADYYNEAVGALASSYTIPQQVEFAEFACGELRSARIPFAVNADSKFIDVEAGEWRAEQEPVLDAILV